MSLSQLSSIFGIVALGILNLEGTCHLLAVACSTSVTRLTIGTKDEWWQSQREVSSEQMKMRLDGITTSNGDT